MKRIVNKKTTDLNLNGKTELTFAEVASYMVSVYPEPNGITKKVMRSDLNLMDKLDGSKEYIVLENSEYERLKVISDNFPWNIRHKDIANIQDAIDNAEEFKLEAATGG